MIILPLALFFLNKDSKSPMIFAYMGFEFMRLSFVSLCLVNFFALPLFAVSPPPLDLMTGWQRVCSYSPELTFGSLEISSHEADICQASLYPNPELSVEVENVCGSRYFDGVDNAELTVALSQPIITAGKISKRTALAAAERDAAEWEYAIIKKRLREKFEHAFARVSILQEKAKLSQQLCSISKTVLDTASRMAENGKSSLLHTKQASIALRRSEMLLSKICSELTDAKEALALFWGGCGAEIHDVSFILDALKPPPCFERLRNCLLDTEEIWLANASLCSAKQLLSSECANQYPDVLLTAGYQHYRESSDHSFLFEIDVELPFFDRNQGNIRKAETEIVKAQWKQSYSYTQQIAELRSSLKQCSTAYAQAKKLKEGLLKEMEESYELTLEAYNQGHLVYPDLLIARETLFSARENYLDCLLDYNQSLSTIRRLTNIPVYY